MRALALSVVLFLAGCGGGFFYPDQVVLDKPERHGIDYEVVPMRARDGAVLTAWFFPARGSAHGTVLYLHGTAKNLSAHFQRVAWLPPAGFNVFALDYRGYGDSGGLPSVAGAELDIDAAMRTLLSRSDVDAERI